MYIFAQIVLVGCPVFGTPVLIASKVLCLLFVCFDSSIFDLFDVSTDFDDSVFNLFDAYAVGVNLSTKLTFLF